MATAAATQEDFFNQRFYSYQEFNEALNIFQTTFFQILIVRTSRLKMYPIKNLIE